MFEFNYRVRDIQISDLGEGIVCLREGSGGKEGGKWGKGGGKWGKSGREVGIRGKEVGNAYPPTRLSTPSIRVDFPELYASVYTKSYACLVKIKHAKIKWAAPCENVSLGICQQRRPISACSLIRAFAVRCPLSAYRII